MPELSIVRLQNVMQNAGDWRLIPVSLPGFCSPVTVSTQLDELVISAAA